MKDGSLSGGAFPALASNRDIFSSQLDVSSARLLYVPLMIRFQSPSGQLGRGDVFHKTPGCFIVPSHYSTGSQVTS